MPKTKKVVATENEVVKPHDSEPVENEQLENEEPAFDIKMFAKMPDDVFSYLFDSAVDAVFGKQPGSRGK